MTRKPRIAFWFRYGPAEHCELFHAVPHIAAGLAAAGCEVHYFGPRSAKPVPAMLRASAAIHELPWRVNRKSAFDKFLKTALWLLALPCIGLACRLKKFDAVYIDETVPLTAWMALLFFGRRTAFTVADFFPEIYFGRMRLLRPALRAWRRLELAAWRRLPLIFTRGAAAAEYLEKNGVPRAAIRHVPDPCDFTIYRPEDKQAAKRALGYSAGEIVLAHHGILHPNKGNDRIIGALPKALAAVPALRFLLIGDGPEKERLRRLVQRLGLEEAVRFTGWLEKMSDVNTALNAADIGLVMRIGLPSDDFHTTGALVHCMACGLPVLSARLKSIAHIIHDGENGFLFEPDDMDEFAEKLVALAQNPELREKFGRRALELASELFDIRAITEKTVAPLLELAARRTHE